MEACEDWPDHCCREHCRKTFDLAHLPKMVAEEAGKRARTAECFRPSFHGIGESENAHVQKGIVEENAKAEIALND